MAASYRASLSGTTNGTSITATVPTNSDGDLLICVISAATALATAFTVPSGWNTLQEYSSATSRQGVFWRIASSEPTDYAWSWSGSRNASYMMMSVQNPHATRPILGFDFATANSATHTAPEVRLNQTADLLLVTATTLGRGSTTTTQPSGYTLAQNPDAGGGTNSNSTEAGLAYLAVSGGSASATTWSTSNGAWNICIHIAILGSGDTPPLSVRDTNQVASESTNVEVNTPWHYDGDRLVCAVFYRGGSSQAITPPSGWTAVGSTVTASSNTYGVGIYEKVASGEGATQAFTLADTPTYASALIIAISPAVEVGTRATTTDTSNDATYDVPAMTLASQSPAAFTILAVQLIPGNRRIDGVPTGYILYENRYPNSSARMTSGLALKVEAGPDPSATTGVIGNGTTAGPNIARLVAYGPDSGGGTSRVPPARR